MRNRYIVTYDITDPKRLRQMYRKMRGFGDAVQLSVFRCDLSAEEHVLLLAAVSEIINHREDRVMIVNTGPTRGRGSECIEFLGARLDPEDDGPALVV